MDWFSIGWQVAVHAPTLAIGIAIGAYGYRYLLKKNPTALEALVQEVNSGIATLENAVSSVTAATPANTASTTTPAVK